MVKYFRSYLNLFIFPLNNNRDALQNNKLFTQNHERIFYSRIIFFTSFDSNQSLTIISLLLSLALRFEKSLNISWSWPERIFFLVRFQFSCLPAVFPELFPFELKFSSFYRKQIINSGANIFSTSMKMKIQR